MTLYDLFADHPLVTTDSRNVPEGSLFFALRGASFDGNRFAADALEKGAAAAVVDDPALPDRYPALRDRMHVVGHVLTALQELAREHRRRLALPILAVAGSNGKTTTKELTACVLAERFRIHATRGNLNNHIGVPLTLLSMDRDTEFGIVEMGASACGEIAALCAIAEPNYGLLTNIGSAHLEGFGGPEGIRRGKGELYDFLAGHGGRAFVPEEDAILTDMAAERSGLAVERYSVSLADGAETQLEGAYNLRNIAAALAVGHYFGVDEARMRAAVAAYTPSNHRSQRSVTKHHNTLIIDCYNANPSSMAEAVGHLLGEPLGERRQRLLILGDMLELGAWSDSEHRALLQQAAADPEAVVWTVGPRFAAAAEALRAAGGGDAVTPFDRTEALLDRLEAEPVTDALILMKGSRGMALERCLEWL